MFFNCYNFNSLGYEVSHTGRTSGKVGSNTFPVINRIINVVKTFHKFRGCNTRFRIVLSSVFWDMEYTLPDELLERYGAMVLPVKAQTVVTTFFKLPAVQCLYVFKSRKNSTRYIEKLPVSIILTK